MVSRSFGVEFFVSLRYRMMSSANRDILTVSLPICIPFISSSCLIVLARNYSTRLNKNGDSGHPCLVPDFILFYYFFLFFILFYFIFFSFFFYYSYVHTRLGSFLPPGPHPLPYLVPDSRRNVFSFSPLSIMLAIGLPYIAFTMFIKEIGL
jgi:hypothetical protein